MIVGCLARAGDTLVACFIKSEGFGIGECIIDCRRSFVKVAKRPLMSGGGWPYSPLRPRSQRLLDRPLGDSSFVRKETVRWLNSLSPKFTFALPGLLGLRVDTCERLSPSLLFAGSSAGALELILRAVCYLAGGRRNLFWLCESTIEFMGLASYQLFLSDSAFFLAFRVFVGDTCSTCGCRFPPGIKSSLSKSSWKEECVRWNV